MITVLNFWLAGLTRIPIVFRDWLIFVWVIKVLDMMHNNVNEMDGLEKYTNLE